MARLFPCTHFVLLLLLQLRSPSAGALEMIDGAHRLTCDQGLTDCSVKDVALPGMKGPVKVSRLELSVFLCCINGQYCKPCLRVTVFFTIKDKNEDQEVSGDYGDEDDSSNQKELREESLLGMPRSTTGHQKYFCNRVLQLPKHFESLQRSDIYIDPFSSGGPAPP